MIDSTVPWLRWMAIAGCLCAILILPVAWDASHGWIFPDSTSYFDMATGAVRETPAVLWKNAYWSPAYPAILALMMAVVRPSLAMELSAVYVLHWLIFLFTTVCFSLLFGTFLRWLRRNSWPELAADRTLVKAFVCFGFAFFLLSNMNQTLWYATPDLLLEGLVYLSAACALRLFQRGSSWKHSLVLGLTLGLGYLTKAAMFPIALVLIGILFLRPPMDRWGRRHCAVALAAFCLTTAPLVLSLSQEKHRFTFGDSGKLNYAYHIGDLPEHAGWTGQKPENGIPAHAPRKLSEVPLILEFRTPVSGTLPIWYDPSYWWEGLRVPISVRRQLNGLFRPFRQVHSRLMIFLALAVGLAPLCLLHFRIRRVIRDGGIQTWILIVWPAVACFMYALVLFSFRYVAGYVVLFCLGATALVLQPFSAATRVRSLYAAILVLALAGAVRLLPIVQSTLHTNESGPLVHEEGRDNGPSSAAVAKEFTRLGILPGDEIGVLGHSLDCYYARLAGVRIVTQIWDDPDQIVGLDAAHVRQILTQMKQVGVKALVSRARPGFTNDEGWIAIPRTDVYVRRL
jgi:hypothetical protein